MIRVSFYGAGQVGTNTAAILRRREGIEVLGPFRRDEREPALTSGADVVVIATTSFLAEIADDIRVAVEAGSHVITTAEEAAQPWARRREPPPGHAARAREEGVAIPRRRREPGLCFDAP